MWDGIRGFLIDRDGVLTQSPDNTPLPGTIRWIGSLQKTKRPFLIATNHTTSSPKTAVMDLIARGFPLQGHEIHTPLSILQDFFADHDPGRVLVLGTRELKQFVGDLEIELTETSDARTVLMGFYPDLKMQDIHHAVNAVQTNHADLIALHRNRLFMDRPGHVIPGLGAWVQAIEYATGKSALIVGKPNAYYFHTALKKLDLDARETVMISDDPFGDLAGARWIGMKTVFVTSGKYPDPSVLNQLPADQRPDIILGSLAEVPLP